MKRRIRCGLYRLALDLVCWPVKIAGALLNCNGYLRILRYKIQYPNVVVFFFLKYTTTKKTLRSVRLREKKIVRSTSGLLHPGTSPTIWSMQYPACSRGSSFFFELTLEKNIHNDPRQNVPCEKARIQKIGKKKNLYELVGKSHPSLNK